MKYIKSEKYNTKELQAKTMRLTFGVTPKKTESSLIKWV